MQTGAQETASQWEKLIPDLARLERFVLWTTTSQIAALENLRPELELLETRLAATNGIQASILEHLIADLVRLTKANFSRRDAVQFSVDSFVADDDLQKLSALARQQQLEFDAFAFMGRLLPEPSADLWRSEIFHSKLLAWLLDPTENHRSGENFLKTFLLQAKAPPAFQSLDWSRSVVFREWTNEVDGKSGYLDILICNEWELALCAIENKVFSGEHSQQLTRYRMALETEFPEFAKHLIFLTPNQLLPAREQEQEHWIPVGYLQVVDAIQRLVDDEERLPFEDVRAFLKQYTTTLRRNIVPDSNTNIKELVREIYLKHREAIDLIIEHMPDFVEETREVFRQAIQSQPNWILDSETNSLIRFRSTDWDQFTVFNTGTGWAASKSLLLFEIHVTNNPGPRLVLTLGPSSDDQIREKIHARIMQSPGVFKNPNKSFTQSWTRLNTADVMAASSHFEICNDPATRSQVEMWMDDFAENQFPAMNEVIVNCLREYEAEAQG